MIDTAYPPHRADPNNSATKLSSLLYISRCAIALGERKAALDDIVLCAHARNPGLGLTGALLFTGGHFAQVLEGNDNSLDQIMAAIGDDPRHDQVKIVYRSPIARRRFANWSLAYAGPSQFVSRHVTRLLLDPLPPEHSRAAEWLNELMWEFTVAQEPTRPTLPGN